MVNFGPRGADDSGMGDGRRVRLLGAFALAAVVLTPTIALAKTLEGTGGTAGPVPPFAVPPNGGSLPPSIVPPAIVPPAIVPPNANPGSDGDTSEGEAAPELPEIWAPDPPEAASESPSPSPSPTTTAPRQAIVTFSPLPSAGPTPRGTGTPTPSSDARAGPAIGRDPAAPALRENSSTTIRPPRASPVGPSITSTSLPTSTTRATGVILPTGSATAVTSTASASPTGTRPATGPCGFVPAPQSPSTAQITGQHHAEVTAGSDLRSRGKISPSASSTTIGAPWSVRGYLLRPESFELIAVFAEKSTDDSDNETGASASPRSERAIPSLRIVRCNDQIADTGIAPGDYLVRYTVVADATGGVPIMLSAALPVRVTAGPTGPDRTAARRKK